MLFLYKQKLNTEICACIGMSDETKKDNSDIQKVLEKFDEEIRTLNDIKNLLANQSKDEFQIAKLIYGAEVCLSAMIAFFCLHFFVSTFRNNYIPNTSVSKYFVDGTCFNSFCSYGMVG
jgi:hypothetical protein